MENQTVNKNKLVQVSKTEVFIEFKLNKKCRANVQIKSLANTTCSFRIQTSSPHKFLVNPPTGFISPCSTVGFQIVLKPQSEPPPSFPRCPSDRFLINITPSDNDNDNQLVSSLVSAQYVKLKVAYVGSFLLRHAVMLGEVDAVKNIIKRQKSVVSELSHEDAGFMLRLASEYAADDSGTMLNLLQKAGLNVDTPRDIYNDSGDGDGDDDAVAAVGLRWESKGWSKLHMAAFLDRKDEVSDILEKEVGELGPLLELRDEEGRTALHLAASKGSIGCAKLLVESGAVVNAKCSKDGRTPLHIAVANGDNKMLEMLIDAGADPSTIDDCGRTPINVSHDNGYDKIVEILERGELVLMAARRGEIERLKSLLQRGATTKYSDQYGLTALHAAAIKGHRGIVAMLLEFGAGLECKDSEGHTPLHLAVECRSLEIVEVLVDCGADINAKNKRGATPLHLAKAIGFEETVHFLQNRSASSSR